MSGSGEEMELSEVTRVPEAGQAGGTAEEVGPRVAVRTPERAETQEGLRETIFDVQDLAVLYGEFRAVRDISISIARNEITA